MLSFRSTTVVVLCGGVLIRAVNPRAVALMRRARFVQRRGARHECCGSEGTDRAALTKRKGARAC